MFFLFFMRFINIRISNMKFENRNIQNRIIKVKFEKKSDYFIKMF